MLPRHKRIVVIVLVLIGIGISASLALTAFRENLLFFYSPSQIAAGEAPDNHSFRVGGLVVEGSVKRDPESLRVAFVLTDTAANINVTYEGILPDLFREGQGIVANGKLVENGLFVAEQVLAKHDENYMPPEVAQALIESGAESPHAGGTN